MQRNNPAMRCATTKKRFPFLAIGKINKLYNLASFL